MGNQQESASVPDKRLEALRALQILDTDYEPPFDRIVRMVAVFFDMPSVGIHLLDDKRQWVKAFEGQRFACPRDESVCQFTLEHTDLLVIPDLRKDPQTCNLEIVTGPIQLRFYAGMPLITRDGHSVGTLCLIDTKVRAPLTVSEEWSLREFAALVTETMELRVDYHDSQRKLQQAIEFDAVTGLRNGASIISEGKRLIDATAAPTGIAIMKVQLDRMEQVIRTTGRKGHMSVVREAARRLRELQGPEDLLGRGNGDNFILMRVRHLRGQDQELERWLDDRASRILTRLAEPMVVGGSEVSITASLGLASFDSEVSAEQAFDAAAVASLVSHNRGGNRVQRFSFEEFSEFRDQVSLEAELRAAVVGKSFVLNYQPIVDIAAGGRVVGAEALLRWPRGDKQPVGPDRFIPIAEDIGLIHELGLWVFKTACRDLAVWQKKGCLDWVSVNLSPAQLADPTLVGTLVDYAEAAGVQCQHIKLEITESALATHIDEVSATLEELRRAGFKLALDDFGTGHSSLARVIRLPFDTLKIDRGFVKDCPDGPGAAVVISMSGLAGRLKLDVVAEGVESESQELFLLDHGYTLGQGYRYARPMPAEALMEHLRAAGSAPAIAPIPGDVFPERYQGS